MSTALGQAGRGLGYTHWTGQHSSTPPPFHTPYRRGGWTPSTHHHHTVHDHTTNQRSRSTTINDHCSMIDQSTMNDEHDDDQR